MARRLGRAAAVAVLTALVPSCLPTGRVTPWTEPVTGLTFVRLQPGTFVMGTPEGEPGREAQERLHEVTLSRAWYLATTEVTQRQWQRIMGTAPSYFAGCDECPVEQVSLHDVQRFLGRWKAATGVDARLPSEAEWEFACRAGGRAAFGDARGELSADDANVDGTFPLPGKRPTATRARTTPVGSFPANAFGLYDMNGNVWEWTSDRHCPYPDGPATDPVGTCASPFMVIRGGSWHFDVASARCGLRYTHRPQDSGFSLGVRLALSDVPR